MGDQISYKMKNKKQKIIDFIGNLKVISIIDKNQRESIYLAV